MRGEEYNSPSWQYILLLDHIDHHLNIWAHRHSLHAYNNSIPQHHPSDPSFVAVVLESVHPTSHTGL